ncbi:MAG: T9SS type A sorting domain-containing protein [Bacteroidota bacterium]
MNINYKTTIIFFLFLFAFNINSSAQLWYITRGLSTAEVAWGVDVDSVGNVYWAVEEKNEWPFWYFNILLFKIDPNGQEVWQSSPYGGTYNDIGFVAKVDGQKVYLAGRTDSTMYPVSGDVLVLSYDISAGSLNWEYKYNPVPDNGYEEIDGIIIQPDGIYLSGWTKGLTTDEDFLIQKISFSGSLIWTNFWDYNNQFDGANGHMAMDNDYLYIAGHVNLLDGSLACFSRINGAYQWDVTWNSSNNDEVLGLTMSSDSMLYTVGYYAPSGGSSQTCIKKFTRSGQLKWTSVFGGAETEDSRALVTDGDSILYVVGTTTSYGNGGKDIFVLKYDTAGTLLDSLFWGGANNETAQDVAIYGDFLYITGQTQSFGNAQINNDTLSDGLLLKINGRTMQAPDTIMTGIINSSNNEENIVKVYPNPFSEKITIEIVNWKNKEYELNIFDLFGKIVFQKFLNSSQETLYLNLQSGMYFMQVKGDNFIQTKKLEVIH